MVAFELDTDRNIVRFTLRPGHELAEVMLALRASRQGGDTPRQFWDCESIDTPTLIGLLKAIEGDLGGWLDALGPPVQTAVLLAGEGQRSLVEAVRGSLGQPSIWRLFSDRSVAERWFYEEARVASA